MEGVKGKQVLSLSFSQTGHWKFHMAPHGNELSVSEDLKNELLLYIKMA